LTTLLVASTGGHLKQLHQLHTRLTTVAGPYHWATFDTPQSRSLLDGEQVTYVPFVGGRDPRNILRNVPRAARVLRGEKIDTVVSTGSAVALPFFTVARALGIRCHYIESAARSTGPSVTGGLMARVPGVHRYTQYPAWADDRWVYRGSVFDSYRPVDVADAPTEPTIRRAVVTLGTFKDIGFRRLVLRLLEILPPEAEVLWQTGDTDVTDLGIEGRHAIPERELIDAMAEADVVVAHAGVGTALAALQVARCPILVPRRLAHGEHVDDHQIQIADELDRRGLALSIDADALTLDDLVRAAGMRNERLPQDPPFSTAV
jgi:UDP-N-acetylglucosamine--N-acetylmuramyl-(pentapeptide) pyrophosphoryl-undecaprenol N-acetylglucosamine transferase